MSTVRGGDVGNEGGDEELLDGEMGVESDLSSSLLLKVGR